MNSDVDLQAGHIRGKITWTLFAPHDYHMWWVIGEADMSKCTKTVIPAPKSIWRSFYVQFSGLEEFFSNLNFTWNSSFQIESMVLPKAERIRWHPTTPLASFYVLSQLWRLAACPNYLPTWGDNGKTVHHQTCFKRPLSILNLWPLMWSLWYIMSLIAISLQGSFLYFTADPC